MSNKGFNWKPIRHLGFGSETICPNRGILDLEVKLSALARRIGEVIQAFHLWTINQGSLIKVPVQIWQEEDSFFGTWVELGFPLGTGRVPSSWQCISYCGRVTPSKIHGGCLCCVSFT